MNLPTLIAECIADAGYGTSDYDEENGECYWTNYGSIVEIVSNPGFWERYDGDMDYALASDFDLGYDFDRYRLRAWSDGTMTSERIRG